MNAIIEKDAEAADIAMADFDGHLHGVEADPIYTESSENFSDRERLALALKTKLKNLGAINSVWLEDLSGEIYVYIDASDTGKSTLRSIFGAQYDIEEEYPHLAFHFRVDSLELEEKLVSNRLLQII